MCSRHRRCICKRVEAPPQEGGLCEARQQYDVHHGEPGPLARSLEVVGESLHQAKTLEISLMEAYQFACSTWESKLTTEELKTWNVECAKRLRAIMQQKQAANFVGACHVQEWTC